VAGSGRTVIFVSHNLVAVQRLCRRALWLRDGRVADDGDASEVVARYLKAGGSATPAREWPDFESAPGNDLVRLSRAAVRPAFDAQHADPPQEISTRTPFQIEIEYWNLKEGAAVELSVHVYDAEDVCVFNAVPVFETTWRGRAHPVGLYRDVCAVPGDLMNAGSYRVELFVVHEDVTIVHHERELVTFEVQDTVGMRGAFHGRWQGAVRPLLPWTTELVESSLPGTSERRT